RQNPQLLMVLFRNRDMQFYFMHVGRFQVTEIIFITIHGTFDGIKDSKNPRWWQAESRFSEVLLSKARTLGFSAKILPFIWSGKNSGFERENAAIDLGRYIKQIKIEHSSTSLHLI